MKGNMRGREPRGEQRHPPHPGPQHEPHFDQGALCAALWVYLKPRLALLLKRMEDRIMASYQETQEKLDSLNAKVSEVGTDIDNAITLIHQLQEQIGNPGAWTPEQQQSFYDQVSALETAMTATAAKLPEVPA
jgi:hypothetical protein